MLTSNRIIVTLAALSGTLLAAGAASADEGWRYGYRASDAPTIVVPSRAAYRPVAPPVNEVRIAGLSARYAEPGTLVTISGSGFYGEQHVFVGGHPAQVVRYDSSQVQFIAPSTCGDGMVTLSSGMVDDIPVGRLAPADSAQLYGLSTDRVVPGSIVTIRGAGIHPEVHVFVGGNQAVVLRFDSTSITFQVPAQIGDGAVTVLQGRNELFAGTVQPAYRAPYEYGFYARGHGRWSWRRAN